MSDEQTTETADDQTTSDAQQAPEDHEAHQDQHEDNGAQEDAQEQEQEGDTFPRSYVEQLRGENARYRQRAQRADELAHRLHRSLVAADGRLADPTDLEFADEHLDDEQALTAAVDELLDRKPHLAARKPRGDVGQGAVSGGTDSVDLAALLRAGAN